MANSTTLHLNLEQNWFDMIASGEKKEEYRELTDYWRQRISNLINGDGYKTITFSNGYSKNRRQMIVLVKNVRIGYGVKKWGANGRQYIIELANILEKNF